MPWTFSNDGARSESDGEDEPRTKCGFYDTREKNDRVQNELVVSVELNDNESVVSLTESGKWITKENQANLRKRRTI